MAREGELEGLKEAALRGEFFIKRFKSSLNDIPGVHKSAGTSFPMALAST